MKTNLLRILLSFFVLAGTTGASYASGGDLASNAVTENVLANSHAAIPINLKHVLSSGELSELEYFSNTAEMAFKIRVDSNGNYVSHKTLSTDSNYMARYIGSQLHKLRFTPAVQNGQHVASWIVIPVRIQ